MDELLHYVDKVREATTPLEILLNVDYLTDVFEKTEVGKEVLKAYGVCRKTQVERNSHEANSNINNQTLQMHRLWSTLRG